MERPRVFLNMFKVNPLDGNAKKDGKTPARSFRQRQAPSCLGKTFATGERVTNRVFGGGDDDDDGGDQDQPDRGTRPTEADSTWLRWHRFTA